MNSYIFQLILHNYYLRIFCIPLAITAPAITLPDYIEQCTILDVDVHSQRRG